MQSAKRSGLTITRILTVYERAGGACGICGGAVTPADATIDHVIPLSRGGTDDLDNLQLAHSTCNHSKHARLPEEYRAHLARQERIAASKVAPAVICDAGDASELGNWITLKQAAVRYTTSLPMLRQAVRRGGLSAERVGEGRHAVWLVRPADVAAYVAAHRPRGRKDEAT